MDRGPDGKCCGLNCMAWIPVVGIRAYQKGDTVSTEEFNNNVALTGIAAGRCGMAPHTPEEIRACMNGVFTDEAARPTGQ